MKETKSVTINSKVILCFDEVEDGKIAMDGWKYKYVIEEIWQRVFRPCFKHGYGDELLDGEEAFPIIEKLSEKYQEVLRDELDD